MHSLWKRTICVLAVLLCAVLHTGCEPEQKIVDPFDITLNDVCIEVDNSTSTPGEVTEEPYLRLSLSVSAHNRTDETLEGGWMTVSLNQEADSYMGDGLTSFDFFASDPFTMIPEGETGDAEKAWGITVQWSPTLSAAQELKEYYKLSLTDIGSYVTSVTVTVHWDGGSQTQEFPITFSEADMALIEEFS